MRERFTEDWLSGANYILNWVNDNSTSVTILILCVIQMAFCVHLLIAMDASEKAFDKQMKSMDVLIESYSQSSQ